MSKKKPITAAELMAQLNADSNFVAERSREEESRQKQATEWKKAERPLIEELRIAGFAVDSAWDFFNRKEPWNKNERIPSYLEALPILLKHLGHPYPDRVRAGIARALAVRRKGWEAVWGVNFQSAWETLIRLYREEPADTETKQALAVTISVLAEGDDDLLGEVVHLAKDLDQGESRVLLLSVLGRSSNSRAKAALIELEKDSDLSKEVQAIFRQRKVPKK